MQVWRKRLKAGILSRFSWYVKYDWLHYNISKDVAFCYLYMQADHQNKVRNANQLLYKLHSHTGKKLFLCANGALTADFQSLSLA